MKSLVRLLAPTAVLLTLIGAPPAAATPTPTSTSVTPRVSVSPDAADAGAFVDLVFTIENTSATPISTVKITFPEDHLAQADLPAVAGWSPTLALGANDYAETATWARGALTGQQQFTVSALLPTDRDQLQFPMQFTFADGRTVTVAGEDAIAKVSVTGATTTTTEATTTTSTAAATAPAGEEPERGGLSIGMYLIGFGVVVIVFLVMRGKSLTKRNELREQSRKR